MNNKQLSNFLQTFDIKIRPRHAKFELAGENGNR